MSKLVIAEKPMLARDIARAITGKEVSESARLPISGKGRREPCGRSARHGDREGRARRR